MIKGVLTYLEQNIKDPIYKAILMNVYMKYGPAYMLSILTQPSDLEINNDFDNDLYYPALLRDVEFSPNELMLYDIVDTIPAGRFSSFSFYIDYEGVLSQMGSVFEFQGASHVVKFNYRTITFDSASKDDYGTFDIPNVNVQVNLGWSVSNHLVIEWFINGEHIQFVDLTEFFADDGGSSIIEFQSQCRYLIRCFDIVVKFFIPNKNYVSNQFLSSIL